MHNSIIMNDERVCDSKVKDFIQTEFKNSVKRDYPIVEFIRHVWKFDPSTIPQTRADGSAYILPHDLCDKYLDSPEYMKQWDAPSQTTNKRGFSLQPRSETTACKHFQELFQKTTEMVKEAWKRHDPERFKQMEKSRYKGRFRFLNEAIVEGNYAEYKPDFSYGTKKGSQAGNINWAGQASVGEVKIWVRKQAPNLKCDVEIDLSEFEVRPSLVCWYYHKY